MNFKKIDMETWPRAVPYRHFIDDLRCVMSMTVEINVTVFINSMHRKGYHFFPTMLWVVSSAVNGREEMRMGRDADGNPGIWDVVHPTYSHFHKEDDSFVRLTTEYSPDFHVFYNRVMEEMRQSEGKRWFDHAGSAPNTFDVSSLPWTHYKNYDMHVFDSGTHLGPVITWGKYASVAGGPLTLPITLQIHHAAADGYHLCRFFQDVEQWMKLIP